jgi:hypothetical protein
MFDWLNQGKKPVLAEMPKQMYKAFRKKLALP